MFMPTVNVSPSMCRPHCIALTILPAMCRLQCIGGESLWV